MEFEQPDAASRVSPLAQKLLNYFNAFISYYLIHLIATEINNYSPEKRFILSIHLNTIKKGFIK